MVTLCNNPLYSLWQNAAENRSRLQRARNPAAVLYADRIPVYVCNALHTVWMEFLVIKMCNENGPTNEELIAACYTIIEWCDNRDCEECPLDEFCNYSDNADIRYEMQELVDCISGEEEARREQFFKAMAPLCKIAIGCWNDTINNLKRPNI